MYNNKIDTKVCQQCGLQLTPDFYCSYCNKSFAALNTPPNAVSVNNSQWKLVCVNGANIGASHLLKQETLLGREPDNDFCIHDDISSRHHAVIQQNQNGIYIQDLGSSNGTYVNNARINSPTYLKAGDLIGIGNTQFILENNLATAQPTQRAANYPNVNPSMGANFNLGSIPSQMPNQPLNFMANPMPNQPFNQMPNQVPNPVPGNFFPNNPQMPNRGVNQASFLPAPVIPSPAYAPVAPMIVNRPQANNPQRRVAFSWLMVSGLGVLGMVLPLLTEMDMMSKGFGIVFLSFFVMLTGIIASIAYFVRAKTLDKLLFGQDLLAYWAYSPSEWQQYVETEFQFAKIEKVPLLILTSVICLIVGGIFAIADPKTGPIVLLVMFGLIALLSAIVFIAPRLRRNYNQNNLGYAYIGTNGVYLNGIFHNWNMLGGSLDDASILLEKIPLLAITYSFPSRTGRQEEVVRIPIPQGQMAMAENIINCLSKKILVC